MKKLESGIDMNIYLADLTYVHQGLQSEVVPHAIGCIGTYAQKMLGERIAIRLFKRPDDFSKAVQDSILDVVGFSHYA